MSRHRRNRVQIRALEKLASTPIWTPSTTKNRMNGRSTATPRNQRPQASEEAIRLAAYYKWESAGKPAGDGVQFWLEAKKDLELAT
jgi:hypothetical protein